MPVDLARPQLVREIVESLTRWEPRIKVLQVLVDLVGLSQLAIRIVWELLIDIPAAARRQTSAFTIPQLVGTQVPQTLVSQLPPAFPRDVAGVIDVSQITDWSRIGSG